MTVEPSHLPTTNIFIQSKLSRWTQP